MASSRLSELLAGLPEINHEPQLVHNDYRAANILTSGSTIVGVLDFDELSVGQPVGDLAYASVYLSTLFTDWRPTPTAVRQQLRAGYESVRALTLAEGRWYDALVLWLAIQAIPGEVDPGGWGAALSRIDSSPHPSVMASARSSIASIRPNRLNQMGGSDSAPRCLPAGGVTDLIREGDHLAVAHLECALDWRIERYAVLRLSRHSGRSSSPCFRCLRTSPAPP